MLDLKDMWHVEQHTLKHSCSSSVTSARVHKLYTERSPKSLHWNTLLSKDTSPLPGCSSCLLILFAFESWNSSDISRLEEEEVFCSQRFEIPISLHLCLSSQTKLLYCWMLPQQWKVLLKPAVPSPRIPQQRGRGRSSHRASSREKSQWWVPGSADPSARGSSCLSSRVWVPGPEPPGL